jgi:HAE1 family hydrophobic/amphiphilic exporter-1
MSLAKVSIQRPLMMIMVILAISLFGLVAWRNLPIDRMPNMDLPYVTVQIIYPGAGPSEVELNVIKPIEDQISTISGLKNMTSYSMESMGYIVLEFNADVSGDLAAIEVKDKISQIRYLLPGDMEEPTVMKLDIAATPIVTIALLGDETVSPVDLRRYADENLKDRFGQIPGVAQTEVTGGREREIHVTLNSEKLAAHNLSIFSVFPAFVQQNALIPAGYVTGRFKEYSVKFDGQFRSLAEIEQIQIPTPGGYNVRLSEIATVTDAYADVREAARFNGAQSVEISITKSGDANTVTTARQVLRTVENLRKALPSGMSLEVVEDQSQFISDSVDDTYGNLVMGVILTAIILLIFLGDYRLTIIAAVTMPVSVIMGFIGMDAMGFTMNMVSMMALSIVVGILVTNAIVVLENITRHRDTGKDPRQAALVGTDEIVVAVIACTLTNLAVFVPIASTTGITASIFQELGLTIVFATVASLFLSFTLVPLMAAYMLKGKESKKRERIIDKLILKLEKTYQRGLSKVLRTRAIKFGIAIFTVTLFFFTMIFITPMLGVDFMPTTDEGLIGVAIELPVGTPMAVTEEVLLKVEDKLKDFPYLKAISSTVGGSGTSVGVQYAEVRLELVPLAERSIDVFRMVNLIRPQLADIPDARITVASLSDGASATNADVEIEILGNDIDSLAMFSERALEVMRTDSELTDFNSSWKGTKPEILVTPKREMMERFGLSGSLSSSITGQMVGATLRYNITGDETAKFLEGGEEYPIRVRLDENSRKDIRDIATMNIMTPRGPIPLEAIANVDYSSSVSQITRVNKIKMLNVTANVVSADIAKGTKTVETLRLLNEKAPLPEGYIYQTAGMQDMIDETMEQLLIAGALAIILTLMLLIALLESIPMGIVIFMTLPLGVIGVIWGLFVTGNQISMISMMSTIMLIGVVSNNAILMVDYARQIRRDNANLTPAEAIVMSAGTKLKAILMSNIAIVVSMIPMALGMGAGGSFRAPFAIAAIGGVIVSAMLTFFVIPVIYIWTAPKQEKLPDL